MDEVRHRARIVAIARRWIGTNYCHQASLEGVGADCLGLFRGIWRELFGDEPADIPSYTQDWSVGGQDQLRIAADELLCPVDREKRQAGDVVVFRMVESGSAKHLGVLAKSPDGHPTFIHAYSMRGVVETAFTAAWARRADSYYAIPMEVN